ncbi:MAG: ABC transporter permease [Alphaproteobacteria bacterium]|nr:ABC transporter permease [Alphaproteobacteria bacterium]
MIRLTPRTNPSPWLTLTSTVVALAATVVIGAVIFSLLGYDAGKALYQFFVSPLSRIDRISDLVVKACPLIIIGLGLVFCYRANIWNIGAEGQFILGALAAGAYALQFPDSTSPMMLPMMMLVAMLAGAAWAAIAALGKTLFNANEILVTLMLTYVAALFIDLMVRGPLRDPMAFGFPLTPMYPDAALITRMPIPGLGYVGQLHYGVLAAFILAPLAWVLMNRTLPGYQVRVVGAAPRAGRFAGFSEARTTIGVLLFSGAMAGLAGMIEVSANIGQLQPEVSFGYGFTAIIVAFLARLNPLAVIAAGLLIAMAELGGDNAQMALAIPKVVTGLFKGILLFFLLAGATLQHYKIEFTFRRTAS